MDVSENRGTPKSSILIRFSIINHPFWGTPIFGNTQIALTQRLRACHFFLEKNSMSLPPGPFFSKVYSEKSSDFGSGIHRKIIIFCWFTLFFGWFTLFFGWFTLFFGWFTLFFGWVYPVFWLVYPAGKFVHHNYEDTEVANQVAPAALGGVAVLQ